MRVKASSVGLPAEEYRAEFVVETGYTGMEEVDVASGDIDRLYDEQVIELDAALDLPCHTGLVLLSDRGSALGRVTADKRVRLVRGDREAFGIHGRSAEQRIALDILLDPEVGIVSLGGRAGTGKSALALCAGLEAVLERRQHRKVIVFRPLFAVGGQELGYLPGIGGREDVALGAGRLRHPRRRDDAGGRRGDRRSRDARSPAAHPHPRPIAARCLRDRRRGAVAGAQRAAHRPVPHRPRQPA